MAAQMVDLRKAQLSATDSDNPDEPDEIEEVTNDSPVGPTDSETIPPPVQINPASVARSTPDPLEQSAPNAHDSTPAASPSPAPVSAPTSRPSSTTPQQTSSYQSTDDAKRQSPAPSTQPQKKLKPNEQEDPEEYQEFDPKDNGLDDSFRLTKYTEFRARRSKVSTAVIDNMLKGFQSDDTDPVKGRLGLSMDASILGARHGGLSLLQAQEVLYPCVDDPYVLGKIACSSVLSNMYALGVTEIDSMLMKLSISYHLTDKERDTVVPLMVKGFRDAARKAGTIVTGGETVLNPWCMIGGVATAVCTPKEYIVPDGCNVGDVLVLTKPLGTQIAMNCYQWLQNAHTWQKIKLVISGPEVMKAYSRSIDVMSKLNLGASKLMHKYKAHAATTIGGFGLLGHAMALARCQKNEVSFVIHNLPVIAKMSSVAKAKGNMFQLTQGLACELSGGLLICLPREQAASFCKDIESTEGSQAWIIGIVEKGDRSARIIDKPRIIEVPSKEREGELW